MRSARPAVNTLSPWQVIALVLLSRIPYLLTHHAQEDAYITARAASNLAHHGWLAFNVGDRYSPVTSIVWGYLAAIPAFMLTDEHLMIGLQVLGLCAMAAALIAVRPFLKSRWSVIVLCLASPALSASYLGMETGIVILYLAVVATTLRSSTLNANRLSVLALLGPSVRPELVLVSGLIALLAWLDEGMPRRKVLLVLCGAVAGLVVYVAVNLHLSNEWVSPTAIAKSLSYQPEHSLQAFARRVAAVISGPFILPFSKFIPPWLYLSCNVLPLLILVGCRRRLVLSPRGGEGRVFWFLLGLAYGLPLVFCVGGVVFPWYLIPSAFFALVLAFWLLPERMYERPLLVACTVAATLAVALAQLLLSFNTGTQEFSYRADIGRWLRTVSPPDAAMLLEPAGYIPFFARLKTYDDIGIVSPDVLFSLRRYGPSWWYRFVLEFQPTWIIDRHDFRQSPVTDNGYRLGPGEQRCLMSRYEMVRMFSYDPANYARSAVALQILKHGSTPSYYVYRKRESSSPAMLPDECADISRSPGN